jgi:hypothetical protein
MTGDDPTLDPVDATPPESGAPLAISAETFREGFGEELLRTLDLSTWEAGRDLSEEYRRIEADPPLHVPQERPGAHRPWRSTVPPAPGRLSRCQR